MGVAAPFGPLGRHPGVRRRLGGVDRPAGAQQVVREGSRLDGFPLSQHLGDGRVPGGAARRGQVGVERVADQDVGEAQPPVGLPFGEEPGCQGAVHGVQRCRRVTGQHAQHVRVEVPAEHGRLPQHGTGRGRQLRQPVPDHVAYPRRYGGQPRLPRARVQLGQFADEERVTAAALMDRPGGGLVQFRPDDGAGQLAGRRRGQPGKILPDRLQPGGAGQGGGQLRADLGGPVGAEDQHRPAGRLRAGEQCGQQVQGVTVGAVQVVEDQQDRLPVGDRRDQRGHRAVSTEPHGGGVSRAVSRAVFRVGGGGGDDGGGRPGERVGDLGPRPRWRSALVLRAASPRRGPALGGQSPGQGLGQCRLAGARVAAEQGERGLAAAGRGLGGAPQQFQLRVAAHERALLRLDLSNGFPEAGGDGPVDGRGEVRRLGQDVGFQPSQLGPRVHAQLGHQDVAGFPQRGQRVALPAGAVPGRREQSPGVLAQRMAGQVCR
ncbi:hypothetical protein GUI43_01083 [Micromonospora noduli]|nr:hypothetical protein GUI43_01083 [Micromonospora noduli]